MEWLHIIVLSLVQGLTEFLPVSSSAHLILVPRFLGWPDQGLSFDVATHLGTLTAVVYYYRSDLAKLCCDGWHSVAQRQQVGDSETFWAIAIGTIPLVVIGFLLKDFVENELRSPLVIASTTILFGLLLGWAGWKNRNVKEHHTINWRDGLIIGAFQALAVIPGTSRSGITMTAALMRHWSAVDAARFSFLLSIPAILLASLYKTYKLATGAESVDWFSLIAGAGLSAISAFFCIVVFLRVIERMGMMPFVIYRLGLGVLLLAVFAR